MVHQGGCRTRHRSVLAARVPQGERRTQGEKSPWIDRRGVDHRQDGPRRRHAQVACRLSDVWFRSPHGLPDGAAPRSLARAWRERRASAQLRAGRAADSHMKHIASRDNPHFKANLLGRGRRRHDGERRHAQDLLHVRLARRLGGRFGGPLVIAHFPYVITVFLMIDLVRNGRRRTDRQGRPIEITINPAHGCSAACRPGCQGPSWRCISIFTPASAGGAMASS